MTRRKSLLYIVLIITTYMFSINCSSSNTGTAQVTINLGFPSYTSNKSDNRSQTRAPANIESIALTVTGSDMDTIESTHTSDTATISLEVLAGTEREFILSASVGSSDPGILLSYRGSTTSDLIAGESVSLTVAMAIYETKLIIPDPYIGGSSTAKIIQFNNFGDTASWVEKAQADFAAGTFRPWDVDSDAQGRIYIANYTGGTDDVIIRIDNINLTNEIYFTTSHGSSGIRALTIDRNSNIVYYIADVIGGTVDTIYKKSVDGTTSEEINVSAEITGRDFYGIAVDSNGYLYIANNNAGDKKIYKIDPNSSGIKVMTSYSTGLNSPTDVMVKGTSLFVANDDSTASNRKIIKLSLDLQFEASLNYHATNFPMCGPQRFVATLNRRIYFIDDINDGTNDCNKLVAMDDILGTNWDTYGSSGSNPGEFHFLYGC